MSETTLKMGSMGFFLCDWSVEFLRYRSEKKKAKKLRAREAERLKNCQDLSIQTEECTCEDTCEDCDNKNQEILKISETLHQYESEKNRLSQLFGSDADVFDNVETVLREASEKQSELEQLREDKMVLSESVAVQLREAFKIKKKKVFEWDFV